MEVTSDSELTFLLMKEIFLFLLALFTGISGCVMPLRVSGRIKSDVTWKGKVILEGDVYVEPKAKLTILAGTRITYTQKEIRNEIQRLRNLSGSTYDIFKEGKIELIIAGDIDIRGTEQKPVIFTAPGKCPERASGINFVGYKSSSTIRYAVIKGGYMGIRIYDERAPLIENVTVTRNEVGAIGCWDRAKPVVNSVLIYENKYGIGASDLASPTIRDSIIKNNRASGVFFEGQSRGIVADSEISGNNVGIAMGNESEAEVISSTITANGSGIGCWGKSSPKIRDNYFVSNIVGIISMDESSPVVENNDFIRNGGGMTFSDKAAGKVFKNRFKKNGPGITVAGRAAPKIYENYLIGNEYGVMIESRSKPRIFSNTFKENRVGMLFTDYAQPSYYGNVFEDNLNNTIDSRLK